MPSKKTINHNSKIIYRTSLYAPRNERGVADHINDWMTEGMPDVVEGDLLVVKTTCGATIVFRGSQWGRFVCEPVEVPS